MTEQEQELTIAGTLRGNVGWELSEECQPHQPVRTLWSAEGLLAPLGATRADGRHCADDRGGGYNGRIVFAGDAGESLIASYTFTLVSQEATLLTLKMTGRFVDGGTGRFVAASGAWTALVHAHMTAVPPTAETTWPVEFAFEGQARCYSPAGAAGA